MIEISNSFYIVLIYLVNYFDSNSKNHWNRFVQLKMVFVQMIDGTLLGQSFVSSDHGRGPLQDEDHSGSHPHSFPGLYLLRSGRVPECPCSSGFMRKSSRRANAPSMRFSVLLNSFDHFFVTLPSISSET